MNFILNIISKDEQEVNHNHQLNKYWSDRKQKCSLKASPLLYHFAFEINTPTQKGIHLKRST